MRSCSSLRLPTLALFAVTLAGCGGSGQGEKTAPPASAASKPAPTPATPVATPAAVPPKPEALGADGGEIGALYQQLASASQAGDTKRVASLTDYTTGAYETSAEDLKKHAAELAAHHPVGGVRVGDRATLLLEGAGNLSAALGASRLGSGWVFDAQSPGSNAVDARVLTNCKTGKWFPCAMATFPDSQVSGIVHPVIVDAKNHDNLPASTTLLDGYGVRMLDASGGKLKFTRVVMVNTAFEPKRLLAETIDDDESMSSAVRLDIEPGGKTATMVYWRYGRKDDLGDVSSGLSLDNATPERVRGRVKVDSKQVGQFDIVFDVGTLSACKIDTNNCGN